MVRGTERGENKKCEGRKDDRRISDGMNPLIYHHNVQIIVVMIKISADDDEIPFIKHLLSPKHLINVY